MYLRISQDRSGEGLAIDRQRRECEALCARKGWAPIEYADTMSASTGAPRPAYRRMLDDVRAGHLDAVVVWDLDRLHRRPIELEEFIALADEHRLALATVTGDVDLSTDNGRLFARIKGSVARAEIERKSVRQKARLEQRRAAGKPWSSVRPFGFEADLTTHHPVEAAALKQAYGDVLAGVGLRAIARRLNEQEVYTSKGNPWVHTTLRNAMRSPRHAGLQPDGTRGEWEPIVSEEVWRSAQAVFDTRSTPGRLPVGLLSGIARCGVCGSTVGRVTANGRPAYACYGHRPDGSVRKCVTRACHRVDAMVTEAVVSRLARDDAVDLLAVKPEPLDLSADADLLRRRLTEMAEAYAEGAFTMREWRTARDKVSKQLSDIEARMVADTRQLALMPVIGSDDVPGVWKGLDIGQQRAIVEALLQVRILPTKPGARFIPEHVELTWV